MIKLTKAQKKALEQVVSERFKEHVTCFSKSQINKPYWKLFEYGFVDFKFGPENSFLKTQGFVPTESGITFHSDMLLK